MPLHDFLRNRPETRMATLPTCQKSTFLGSNCRTREASVEFIARYRVAGRGQRLHESSRFVREDGVWYYLDGEFAGAAESTG